MLLLKDNFGHSGGQPLVNRKPFVAQLEFVECQYSYQHIHNHGTHSCVHGICVHAFTELCN